MATVTNGVIIVKKTNINQQKNPVIKHQIPISNKVPNIFYLETKFITPQSLEILFLSM